MTLDYLCLSDVHLGHSTTPTSHIVKSLDLFFDHYRPTSPFCSLDGIFIAGDLFDQRVDCTSESFYCILAWVDRLVRFCDRHDLFLRLLEGTPSHDRRQNRLVESLAKILSLSHRVRWISDIEIETINGVSILYIPDEIRPTPLQTQQDVQALFDQTSRETVDIGIFHGMFPYQVEHIPGNHATHDEAFYLSKVRGWIHVGHIHLHTKKGRIVPQGSFDRLAHGEEGPKGAVRAHWGSTPTWEFLENSHALRYLTWNASTTPLESLFSWLEEKTRCVPEGSHLRIVAPVGHGVFAIWPEIKKRFPFFHWKKQSIKETVSEIAVAHPLSTPAVQLRSDNIVAVTLDALKETLTPNEGKALRGHLVEIKNRLED